MAHDGFIAKLLRFIGIVLVAVNAGLTFLSGIGTACVAFVPTNPSWVSVMGGIAKLQWLYIIYVLAGIALGIAGIRNVVLLVKGKPNAYRSTLIVLILGLIVGATHIITSRMLRGDSMPVDPIVYVSALTLVIFMLFRLPGVWSGVDFAYGKGKDNQKAGGAAAILLGAITLTIQIMMRSTHTMGGVNFADAFNLSMMILSTGFLLLGFGILVGVSLRKSGERLSSQTESQPFS